MEPHICQSESRQGEMERIRYLFAPSLGKIRASLGLGNLMSPLSPKDYVRTLLSGEVILSVPVEGGNSQLKSRCLQIGDVMISRHGEWQHRHLGAWQAMYGKTPYFQHLFPRLQEVYIGCSEGSLMEFNRAVFNIVEDFLELDAIKDSVVRLKEVNPRLLEDLRNESLLKSNETLTVFDTLFRLGKDAVYLFI